MLDRREGANEFLNALKLRFLQFRWLAKMLVVFHILVLELIIDRVVEL